jgi:tetratricopeptide (TPR) repeat protein
MTFVSENSLQQTALAGLRVALLGKLAGMSRRDAQKLVREHGGMAVDDAHEAALIVIGEHELPLGDAAGEELLDDAIRQAADEGRVSIIGETELWRRLGLLDEAAGVRRLYTPAMLADLLGVPVAVIRRWHRRGLIVPVREVRRLPYFDFAEVATARSLAQLLAGGISPAALEKKLTALARFLPGAERRLTQLNVIVEGKQILLRQGDGLIDPGGQLRFDFVVSPPRLDTRRDAEPVEASPPTFPIPNSTFEQPLSPDDLARAAADLEDEGRLAEAAELYRVALAAGGANADLNFRLAELLYRQGDLSAARERYYAAIELDEDYVEARANLGCVLSETGQRELAVAAFEGALAFHPDYADAHYHLARTLDDLSRCAEAQAHWRAFLELSPDSPWADQARARLKERAISDP